MDQNDPDYNLFHCSACGAEVDNSTHLDDNGHCGTCSRRRRAAAHPNPPDDIPKPTN